MQSALPGIRFRNDSDRLVTVGTPHAGSAAAEHFGDFLGTRATSLKPRAALMLDLNRKLDLPRDVLFASIVIRSLALDLPGSGSSYDHLADHEFLEGLPAEYREG